nr:RNA-directed DNA polymerase, eukaryota [Tanacetum cinerariifolium]
MGDFNEVRSADERRGLMFYPSIARCFNNFISSSGLVDIKLEGFSFTWSHHSASKLSKLDRFLVSEGILVLFPSISALCLDRHLSDHRPILLHEVHTDFGPFPFCFYHSWFSFEGFDDMVEHTWNSFSLTDYNGMIRFKKKLQGLKIVIRNWVKAKKHHLFGVRCSIKNELSDIDKDLDRGDISDSKLHRRMDLLHQLHYIDISNSKDFIQKSKIKWAVEGDENSKFFHGIINKKRSQLAVRGVFVDGLWVTDPCIFKGISLNGKSSISHLFYADDAMFVGEWSEDNLKSTVSILKCFFLASGLKINIHKSQVLGVGVPYYLVEQATNLIGCSVMDKCFRYLGVKVDESTSRHKAWSDLIQKLRSRLSKWKVKTLSIGGRLTLLKSVLGASPIYNMSIYKVPKVLAAKKNGGQGVSSFHALNHALLLKWVWRYISQDGSLWYRVIQAIHGPSIESHASQVSANWCSILRELEVLKSKGFNFLSHCSKRIGDGSQTRFWQDRWLAGMVFRDSFPRIFALELDKDVSVASKMREDMVGSFRRNVRDGVERQQFSELLFMLESVSLSSAQDRWCCDLSGDVSDWSSWFSTIRLSHKLKAMLGGVFYIAWWSIWVFRNRSIFDASPPR